MYRIAIGCIVLSAVLMYFGLQELRLYSASGSKPTVMTVAELEANGSGDNAWVEVHDFIFGLNFAYEYKENDKNRWTTVWVPVLPQGGEYHRLLAELSEKDPDPAHMPPPKNVKIIAKLHTPNEASFNQVGGDPQFDGLIINKIESLSKDSLRVLEQAYPNVDLKTCLIIEVGRHPAGLGKMAAMLGGGLVVLGLGLALGVYRFVRA